MYWVTFSDTFEKENGIHRSFWIPIHNEEICLRKESRYETSNIWVNFRESLIMMIFKIELN